MTSNTVPEHASKLHSQKALLASEAQDVIDILQRSARNVQEIINVAECSIALVEPEEDTLFLYSTQHEADEKPSRLHFHMNEEIKAWIASPRKPISITTTEQASLLSVPIPVPGDFLLSIPLVEHDHFVGILSVRSVRALDERQIQLLPVCADQVTLILSKMIEAGSERQETARTKARFFSMIAHELRSPLNSINGYLELALSGAGGELNEQQYEFLQRARMGSESFYALLENLLVISRADHGQMRLKREIIRLQDVVDNAIEELELSASDQNIAIEVDSVRAFSKIYVDGTRLRQVLRNLIDNALHFTSVGGQVTIHASRDDPKKERSLVQDDEEMGVLRLQVRDTGIGIATEYHSHIFERAFQVPGEAKGRGGGQGLGLTIVKLIVELHGGNVFVESKPGQGSTFTCLLPCILP